MGTREQATTPLRAGSHGSPTSPCVLATLPPLPSGLRLEGISLWIERDESFAFCRP
jgi:hypothetical protein